MQVQPSRVSVNANTVELARLQISQRTVSPSLTAHFEQLSSSSTLSTVNLAGNLDSGNPSSSIVPPSSPSTRGGLPAELRPVEHSDMPVSQVPLPLHVQVMLRPALLLIITVHHTLSFSSHATQVEKIQL